MSDAVSSTGIEVRRRPLPATPVAVTSSSVASPTVITTTAPHLRATGDVMSMAGHTGSTPALDGDYEITVISPTTFSLATRSVVDGVSTLTPVAVTVAGSGGTATPGFVTIGEVTHVGPGGKSRNKKETSTHNDGSESHVLGIVRQKDPTLKINFVSDNPTHILMNDDFDNKVKATWQIAFPSGRLRTGEGYVQAFEYDDAGVDDVEGATTTLTWAGPVTETLAA